MHIHILGIAGTFMAGLALLARALGHRITGSDQKIYPPMSTQLREQDIHLNEGYSAANIYPKPDLVIIGNALSRGNEEVEAVLNQKIPYTSGAQWLAEHVLVNRYVLAVAGTHGKTTTTGMLAWLLESAGLEPGFLIGGVPGNFDVSARLGNSPYFVIEADEYDTAFFDKRSKFIHYRPNLAILANLEFDHADIFADVEAIQRQFHYLIRTVPANGNIIANGLDSNLAVVLNMGCWTPIDYFGGARGWQAEPLNDEASRFRVIHDKNEKGAVTSSVMGKHNMMNALSAIAAAHHVGVEPGIALRAFKSFRQAKRRLEKRAVVNGVTIYDDFAHHPTAIGVTLQALRAHAGKKKRIIAIVEPRSNTMRMGVHKSDLARACETADQIHFLQTPDLSWDIRQATQTLGDKVNVHSTVDDIIFKLAPELIKGDQVLIMSNGAFDHIHEKLIAQLEGSKKDKLSYNVN